MISSRLSSNYNNQSTIIGPWDLGSDLHLGIVHTEILLRTLSKLQNADKILKFNYKLQKLNQQRIPKHLKISPISKQKGSPVHFSSMSRANEKHLADSSSIFSIYLSPSHLIFVLSINGFPFNSYQITPTQIKWNQIETNQSKSKQIKIDHFRTNQDGSNQIRFLRPTSARWVGQMKNI